MKSGLTSIKAGVILCTCTLGILALVLLKSGSIFSAQPVERTHLQSQKPSPTQPLSVAIQNKMPNDMPEAAYRETLARLRSLKTSGSLDDLAREGDEIERRWGTKGGKNYGLLFRELLAAMTSSRIIDGNSNALDLGEKYAQAALKQADSYDLESEWFLLMYLRYPVKPTSLDGPGVKQRKDRVKLWLHVLHRIEKEKDNNFDAEDLPLLNVQPPPSVNGLAGMAPEEIKDPKLRAMYERAIAENTKKIEYFSYQLKLRKNEALIVKNGVKYISKMYAQTPSDTRELIKLLDDYDISSDLRKSLKTETENLIKHKE